MQDSDGAFRDRIAELEHQIVGLVRGGVAVVARADGAAVTAAEGSATGRVIQLVVSELRREVPYDSCSIQELRGERLVIVGGVGFDDLDVLLGESFDVDNIDIPNGEVVHRRRPLVVADTDQYRAFRRGLHVGAGIRSWLGVPLLYGDRLTGMMTLDKKEPGFYGPEYQAVAAAYGSLIAMAMLLASEEAEESTA